MDEREITNDAALAADPSGAKPEGDYDSFFPEDSGYGLTPVSSLCTEPALQRCDVEIHEGLEHPVVGRYLLIRKLGQGGMGGVYRARHLDFGTEVAVKVLLPGIVSRLADLAERFFEEARLAAGLESEHLVRVLGVAEDEPSGAYYLVMELIDGATAEQWLDAQFDADAKPTQEVALELAIAATRGLAAAHAVGLVHRDVKPANIMLPLDADGRPVPGAARLTDHGLARPIRGTNTLSNGRVALGSPGYMAPEQARDMEAVGKPADVFAMGATLYALLAGRAPFQGASAFDALGATMRGDYERISAVRPDVATATCEVIQRCLSVRPEERYPDAHALLAALEACRAPKKPAAGAEAAAAEDDAPLVRKPAPWERESEQPRTSAGGFVAQDEVERRRRLRRIPLILLFVVLAVAGVLGVFVLPGLSKSDDAPPPEEVEVALANITPVAAADAVAWVVNATGGFQLDHETVIGAPDRRRPIGPDGWVFSETSTVSVKLQTKRDVRLELAPDTKLRMDEGGPFLESGSAILLAGKLRMTLAQGSELVVGDFMVRAVDADGDALIEHSSGGRGLRVEAGRTRIDVAFEGRACSVPAGCAFSIVRGSATVPATVLSAGDDNPSAVTMRITREGASVDLEFPAGARSALRRQGRTGLAIMHFPDSVAGETIRGTIRTNPDDAGTAFAIERGDQQRLF